VGIRLLFVVALKNVLLLFSYCMVALVFYPTLDSLSSDGQISVEFIILFEIFLKRVAVLVLRCFILVRGPVPTYARLLSN
jgi:hypothetical protein